jgi:mono/diheme cytochrome c family protein
MTLPRPQLHTRAFSLLLLLSISVMSGCDIRQGMYNQPKNKENGASTFFKDKRNNRPIPVGTVARGQLHDDTQLYQGLVDGRPAETFPFPITADILKRGQERFNIYCSVCHDAAGTGNGVVVKRGFKQPPSYHEDRLRNASPGYFVDVMTRGFGAMSSYAAQIKPEDRWAIAAYIRALQLSQNATLAAVPAEDRAALEASH